MNIEVFGRLEIETERYYELDVFKEPHILISITSDEIDLQNAEDNVFCNNILSLKFEDIDDLRYSDKYILFNEDMAHNILNFVDKNINTVGSIVVHCDAGICRSAGCAAALSKIINESDDYYFKKYCPNMLVYSKLLNRYYHGQLCPEFDNIHDYHVRHIVRPELGVRGLVDKKERG